MEDHIFGTPMPSDIVERIEDSVALSRRLQAEAQDVCERSSARRDYLIAARSNSRIDSDYFAISGSMSKLKGTASNEVMAPADVVSKSPLVSLKSKVLVAVVKSPKRRSV